MADMFQEVLMQGIRLRKTTEGNQKTLCPKCSHTRAGANQKDPCLSVTIYSDHVIWNCHHCPFSGGAGNSYKAKNSNVEPTKKEYKKPDVAAEKGKYSSQFPPAVLEYLTGTRKISKEIIAEAKLSWLQQGDAICFPYYENGTLVNIKHRNWKEKKMWQTSGAKQIFYGFDEIKNHKELIIVEGEFDRLSIMQGGLKNVVSVPAGAPNEEVSDMKSPKFDFLAHSQADLEKVERFIIAVDNDNNGRILQKELVRRLGKERCWIVTWPDDCKDANEVHVKMGVDMVLACINDAAPCPIEGLFRVSDFEKSLQDYFTQEIDRGVSTGWANVDNYYTVMEGELTIVSGIPNSGKSEWLDALTVSLAKHNNWKFAVFSPENSKEQHVTKLAEKIVRKSSDPRSEDRMSFDEFGQGYTWVNSRYYFIEADNQANLPTLDWILEKASAAVLRYGVKGLIIDPYNEIEHKIPQGMNETHYISQLLSRLKRFAKTRGVHIWVVAHPAKLQKDKDGNIQMPTLYDISGSANWANKADNGIIIHRGAVKNVTEVHIKKVRFKHVGKQGDCTLVYEKVSGTYSVPASEGDGIDQNKKRRYTNRFNSEQQDEFQMEVQSY